MNPRIISLSFNGVTAPIRTPTNSKLKTEGAAQAFDHTNPQYVHQQLSNPSIIANLSSQQKITIAETLLNREGGFDINAPLNLSAPANKKRRLLDYALTPKSEYLDKEFATFLVKLGANPFLCEPSRQWGMLFDEMTELFDVEKQFPQLSTEELDDLNDLNDLNDLDQLEELSEANTFLYGSFDEWEAGITEIKKLFWVNELEKQLAELSPLESEKLSKASKLYKAYTTDSAHHAVLFNPAEHIDLGIYIQIIQSAIGKTVNPVAENQVSSLIDAANHLQISNALTIRNLLSEENLNAFIKTHPRKLGQFLELLVRIETTTDSKPTAIWLVQALVTIATCCSQAIMMPSNKQAIQDVLNNISNIHVSKKIQFQIAMLKAMIDTNNSINNDSSSSSSSSRSNNANLKRKFTTSLNPNSASDNTN